MTAHIIDADFFDSKLLPLCQDVTADSPLTPGTNCKVYYLTAGRHRRYYVSVKHDACVYCFIQRKQAIDFGWTRGITSLNKRIDRAQDELQSLTLYVTPARVIKNYGVNYN